VVLLSFVLVIVAAVTLVIGLLTSGLPLVFISIACSAVAGVVLIVAVLRSRPRPVAAGGGPAPLTATAEPQWGGTPTAVFADDDEEAAPEPATAAFVPATAVDFPIEDYDDLRVGEIVPLLSELDVDELEAVRDHETAGKARASILTRVDVLLDESRAGVGAGGGGDDAWTARDFPVETGGGGGLDVEFPIADYDDLRVGEITPLLAELEPDELETVRRHENAGKARAGIIARIDALLGTSAPAKRAPAKRTPAKKSTTTAKKATSATKTAAKKTASTAKKTASTAKKATAAKKPAAKKTR
jgi:hypothetical protein